LDKRQSGGPISSSGLSSAGLSGDVPIGLPIFTNNPSCPKCGDLWNSTNQNVNVITAVYTAVYGAAIATAAYGTTVVVAVENGAATLTNAGQTVGAAAETYVPGGVATLSQARAFIGGLTGSNPQGSPPSVGGMVGTLIRFEYNNVIKPNFQ
jgi:hypothetical protein